MVLNFFKKILKKKPKIIVILGQTATGKTSLSIEVAKRYHGEIISADSRQVYRGMDIGTAKVTPTEMDGVPHHMINIVNPHQVFTVAEYVKTGTEIIDDILKRKNTPIICGGTGMYIDALIYQHKFPEIAPNKKLRNKLEVLSTEHLFNQLQKQDPSRAKTIDPHNRIRLIRALEILDAGGNISPLSPASPYNALFIGLEIPKEILHERIHQRIIDRFNTGMLKEAQALLENGLSHARLEELGLEYRYMSRYLRNIISYQEMLETLELETRKFAKRQKTWFKRNKNIHWFDPRTEKEKIYTLIENFINH